MNPFTELRLVPHFGRFTALLQWNVDPAYMRGNFIVFKSEDGIHNWTELTSGVGLLEWEDKNLVVGGKIPEVYYRVILQFGGKRYDSSVISTFGSVTRQEFGLARTIMIQEFRQLRKGIPIKLYKQNFSAPLCEACTDPDTGQRRGGSLCPECWGTGRKGGYYPAVDTFMRIISESPISQIADFSGAGAEDTVKKKIRMIAVPTVGFEDLLVDPSSDKRYLVETLDVSKVNGKIPVIYEIQVVLLRRTDIRYQL